VWLAYIAVLGFLVVKLGTAHGASDRSDGRRGRLAGARGLVVILLICKGGRRSGQPNPVTDHASAFDSLVPMDFPISPSNKKGVSMCKSAPPRSQPRSRQFVGRIEQIQPSTRGDARYTWHFCLAGLRTNGNGNHLPHRLFGPGIVAIDCSGRCAGLLLEISECEWSGSGDSGGKKVGWL
jgi:hypothetical protein